MSDQLRVAGIVLAAGASTRMGANKMLLTLDGMPLAARAAARSIAAGFSPVVVVAGFQFAAVRAALTHLSCDVIENVAFTEPSSASMHRGLERLPVDVDAVVVTLGDMVHVTSEMIRDVAVAATESSAPLVVSRYGDVTAPPILFRRELFPELLAWTGEGCGKPVVRAHMHEARVLDWPARALEDVDTPEDFARVTTLLTGPLA